MTAAARAVCGCGREIDRHGNGWRHRFCRWCPPDGPCRSTPATTDATALERFAATHDHPIRPTTTEGTSP